MLDLSNTYATKSIWGGFYTSGGYATYWTAGAGSSLSGEYTTSSCKATTAASDPTGSVTKTTSPNGPTSTEASPNANPVIPAPETSRAWIAGAVDEESHGSSEGVRAAREDQRHLQQSAVRVPLAGVTATTTGWNNAKLRLGLPT
ncbi:hypothetical protein PG999_001266 [Apiospora kogelbergensis]|uniref:Uncharacterized protein n=1 Tax=Apiospora kogelbergensis TaxID=1337665 RepID=A0AAW0RE62_9PEZI